MNKPAKQTKPSTGNHRHELVFASQSYEGMIPPPQMMSEFMDVDPTFPERIMAMAEREAAHRHKNELLLNKGAVRSTYLGMVLGFLAVVIVGYLVYYALTLGHPTAAAGIATGVIVAVAVVFVYRKRR